MNREELFIEIEALRLDIDDPTFPRNLKNVAQERVKEIFAILYPEPDPAIEAEQDLAMYEMNVADEITFEELFEV